MRGNWGEAGTAISFLPGDNGTVHVSVRDTLGTSTTIEMDSAAIDQAIEVLARAKTRLLRIIDSNRTVSMFSGGLSHMAGNEARKRRIAFAVHSSFG
jgi:hypothetical protein